MTVSEDADCQDFRFLARLYVIMMKDLFPEFSVSYTDRPYEAIEVDCWATGDRVCRFHANVIKRGTDR